MDIVWNDLKTVMILALGALFVILVTIRTIRNVRWVRFGEAFGKQGESLLEDYAYLIEKGIECRVEQGLPTGRLFRPLAKNLDDRVALFVHRKDEAAARELLK
ncbi:hypothetical protein [Exiguobacterium sp. ZOR0005]|uniref:hypothetical protein n=1 Tax=Exiguobacterium sp. ZOR0005 TaxID=1339226 RepID=UPI00041550DC|nr:hypothetical protein [Exiguobacterium sp. ZOR0005]